MIRLFCALSLIPLSLGACSKTVDPPGDPCIAESAVPLVPGPTTDLTGYFVQPSAGYIKIFTGPASQTYVKDTTVNGHLTVDVVSGSGNHEYLRMPDRYWVGTLDATSTLFLLCPPLAAIPELMPDSSDHVANSGFLTQSSVVAVRRITRLIDTGLTETVPAGTFNSVVRIRQEFWVFGVDGFNNPKTFIDSSYRWFAPGVDEIRRVLWKDGATDSTLREMTAGVVNGVTYPTP